MATRKQQIAIGAALFAFVVVWLSNAWSPSHYAWALHAFGATNDGLVFGEPRALLSDEWGEITPLIQATVNNGLARFNATSFYGEDLRSSVSMPILDWGLAFKPDKWLYPLVNAAYAFSFQWLFILVAFLVGYALLFRRLGTGILEGIALALALFFTAFVQIWWTVLAYPIGLFPWLLLTFDIRYLPLRFAALVWVGTCWLLGYFYPPLFLPLAVAGAAIVLALHAHRRNVLPMFLAGLAAVIASGIAVLYLSDYLIATAQTFFPGRRRMNGGDTPAMMLAQSLWPGAFVDLTGLWRDYAPVQKMWNLAELSAVGSYYVLLVAAFLDYRQIRLTVLSDRDRRLLIGLVCAYAALLTWQMLPVPGHWVSWIGFDQVVPRRVVFASGLTLLLLAAQLVRIYGLVFGFGRYVAFAVLVVVGWYVSKGDADLNTAWPDLVILPLALFALAPAPVLSRYGRVFIAGAAALWGVIAFGFFNPVQSAWPIFNREVTPLLTILADRARHHPQGVLVSAKFGATLNGLGFKSVQHVLLVPPMRQWAALFPDLDPERRDRIFNRFAHVLLTDEDRPRNKGGTLVLVPWAAFEDPLTGAVDVVRDRGALPEATPGGAIDSQTIMDGNLHIRGWAPWSGLSERQRLTVYADRDLTPIRFERQPRPDIAAQVGREDAVYSGFELVLRPATADALKNTHGLCVVATGTVIGQAANISYNNGACLSTAPLVRPGAPAFGLPSASR